jgi:hypothetical protein
MQHKTNNLDLDHNRPHSRRAVGASLLPIGLNKQKTAGSMQKQTLYPSSMCVPLQKRCLPRVYLECARETMENMLARNIYVDAMILPLHHLCSSIGCNRFVQ